MVDALQSLTSEQRRTLLMPLEGRKGLTAICSSCGREVIAKDVRPRQLDSPRPYLAPTDAPGPALVPWGKSYDDDGATNQWKTVLAFHVDRAEHPSQYIHDGPPPYDDEWARETREAWERWERTLWVCPDFYRPGAAAKKQSNGGVGPRGEMGVGGEASRPVGERQRNPSKCYGRFIVGQDDLILAAVSAMETGHPHPAVYIGKDAGALLPRHVLYGDQLPIAFPAA